MIVTHYTSPQRGLRRAIRVAVVADLHDHAPRELFERLREERPTFLALPGDFIDGARESNGGLAFLRAAAGLWPTYCSLGNHERKAGIPNLTEQIKETGAELLDDRAVFRHGLWIGGLSTGWAEGQAQSDLAPTPAPCLSFIDEFAAREGCRLLLCHHPEYYEPYLREKNIPLILSGHAHGGQWELFGRGIFAPGQGILPRYTAGLYEGRLLVSRGLCRTRRILPRFGNPRELVILDLWPA